MEIMCSTGLSATVGASIGAAEMGFFRVELGNNLLGIENNIAWATPGTFTTIDEEGRIKQQAYTDPSRRIHDIQKKLRSDRSTAKQ